MKLIRSWSGEKKYIICLTDCDCLVYLTVIVCLVGSFDYDFVHDWQLFTYALKGICQEESIL